MDTKSSHPNMQGISSSNPGVSIFDSIQDQEVEAYSERPDHDNMKSRWAPVIGNGSRATMLAGCTITCPAFTDTIPIAEDAEFDPDDAEFDVLLSSKGALDSKLEIFGTRHFHIPKFAGAYDIAGAWECYTDTI
jgi:hypothetical protein